MIKMLAVIFATVTMPIWAASAQDDLQSIWDRDPRIPAAAVNLRNVIGTIALALAAYETCGVGDSKPWDRALHAVQRRHDVCVRQDSNWIALKLGLEDEVDDAWDQGLIPTAPTLLFLRAYKARRSRAVEQGTSFCTDTPWKLMLDPDAVTPRQIEEDKRIAPNGDIEKALAVMAAVLSLGKNTRWVDQPCDKDYWPAGFTLNK